MALGQDIIPKTGVAIVRLIGAALLVHAMVVAIVYRDSLKPHFHHVEGSDFKVDLSGEKISATSSLSLVSMLEVIIGALLVIVSQALLTARALMQIRRKEVAGSVGRYDHATFSGIDFAHFKHRGSVTKGQL